jgi:hypothetical protein
VEKVVGISVLGTVPTIGRTQGGGRRFGLPAWINSGLLLVFLIGLVIGAGLGALIVGLM